MNDSAEGNQFIMVIPKNEVLFNEIQNGLYYHNMEDSYLVLVNVVEENREGYSCRELSGTNEDRRVL